MFKYCLLVSILLMFAYASINDTEIDSFLVSDFDEVYYASGFSPLPDSENSGLSPELEPDTPILEPITSTNDQIIPYTKFNMSVEFDAFDFDVDYFNDTLVDPIHDSSTNVTTVYPIPETFTNFTLTESGPEPDTFNETVVLDYYDLEDYFEPNITLTGKKNLIFL